MFRVTSRQNQEFSCNQRPGRGRGVNVCVCVCVCLKRGKIQATKRFTSDWLRRSRHFCRPIMERSQSISVLLPTLE